MVFFCWLQYSFYLAHSAYLFVIFGLSVLISAYFAFFLYFLFIYFFLVFYFVNVAFLALSNVFFYFLPTVVYCPLKNSHNMSAFFYVKYILWLGHFTACTGLASQEI